MDRGTSNAEIASLLCLSRVLESPSHRFDLLGDYTHVGVAAGREKEAHCSSSIDIPLALNGEDSSGSLSHDRL